MLQATSSIGQQRTAAMPDRAAFAGLAAFAAFAFLLIVPFTLNDGDTGWHLATGAWIVEHGQVPTTDPFSYTAAGRHWVSHEWLAELAMHLAYRAGGWSGLVLLFAAALGGLYAILGSYLGRWLGRPAATVALLLVTTGLLPSMLARPHLLALPMLAAWTMALLDARTADRAPPLPWAVLMLAWANAHGSFVFGLGLAGAFALEALVDAAPAERLRVVRQWAAFGIAALAAALCTPSGIHALIFPFYVGNLELLSELVEWQPTSFRGVSGFEVILLGTLFVLLVRPTRIPPVRLLLVLGTLHLTLQHTRQEIVLVVLGALLLAKPIGRAWARPGATPPLPRGDTKPAMAVLLALAIALAGYRLAVPLKRGDSATVPATALLHLPPELSHQRVFNEYSFGGALIHAGIRPYIDGRSDMYGDAHSLDYFRIARGDVARWQAADARWRFGWTMLSPRSRLVPVLDADPRWRRAYADGTAAIHIRR
jgi:hypothetical protein